MNLLQQLTAIFPAQNRAVAKITQAHTIGYTAQTSAGNDVILKGNGYQVGDHVFYDINSSQILDKAPDLPLIELIVE